MDLVGLDALHRSALSRSVGDPYEVRARVAARCDSMCDAQRIGDEVETLYTNGPAGGGGVAKSAREVVAVTSTFVRRADVCSSVTWMEA
jgi:hypothetical protein